MNKQQLLEQYIPSRRRFLKILAAGSIGMLGGGVLLATANAHKMTFSDNTGRAFTASTTVDFDSASGHIIRRRAV